MAPKSKTKDFVEDEDSWRVAIESATLDEDDWTVKVIFIEAAGSEQERIYLTKFETFAALEKRFVIKNICKTETIFMVNQLGSDKKVKDESLRVFEEGNSYIRDKKDIPPDICALIIKYLILKIKDEYLFIRRQRLEVKEGIKRESATMIDKIEVKGTVSGPTISQAPATDTDDDEKNKDKKFNTALRERGEEWRDKVYVDDYPIDSPNIYVAITGFVDPYLPLCLVRIGIPLTAVVQVRIDPNITRLPTSLTKPTKRGQSQTELLADQSLKFWSILQSLRIQVDTSIDFKNTAFLVFFPPYRSTDELSGDPDKVYDELCFLMYDVQDLSRQHLNYLDNMDVVLIPESHYDARYERYYHKMIDNIPLECITIYSVLDSILSAACDDKKLDYVSMPSTPSTNIEKTIYNLSEKDKKSEALIEEVFKTLCRTETNKKQYRITFGEEYENHKDPIVIEYGDIVKYNTFHIGNINLKRIVSSSLLGMPMHKLWLTQHRSKDEVEAKLNFHINVLLSCFERKDVETSELNRLLNILACRKLYNNRSSLKKTHIETTTIADFKKVYLKRSIFVEPLPTCPSVSPSAVIVAPQPSMNKADANELNNISDNIHDETSSIKILFECPDISELVSAVEIANNKPIEHMIDNYDCFEDFAGITAFQIMCEAFNKFNCIDYKYCEVTDSFILMFFNSHDDDGISRNEWRYHLTTPLCLQDFFDYVLEEEYEWIQNQELIYDANFHLQNNSVINSRPNFISAKVCLDDTEVADDLLMEGSLKYHELLASIEEEEQGSHFTDDRTGTSATAIHKMSRNTKLSTRNITRSFTVSTDSLSGHVHTKPFLGYDLGNRRVEVFGKDATFFSKDGTKVSTKYSLTIPYNLEYIIMNITPGNSYNEFWFHKALGEFVKPEMTDICDSFRITGKDHVMVNIKKQYCESLVANDSTYNSLGEIREPEYKTKLFYKLFLTWPNGLITETIYEKNSFNLSHIKQYFICENPNLHEAMRCISLHGEVIIFKESNEIEVFKPDGSYIKITDYYKKPIYAASEPEIIEPEKSIPKIKSNKSVIKGSKLHISDTKLKINDYELVIDSFEYIDTNGVRRRYVQEIPFELGKLLIRTATDYCLGEIFSKRLDGTTTLLNKDGVFMATFPDNTRIITYYVISDEEVFPEWTDEERLNLDIDIPEIEIGNSKSSESTSTYKKLEEEESTEKPRTDGYIFISLIYTIEHQNFSTVTINKSTETVSIDSPNNMTVTIDKNNQYNFSLDNLTTAEFDGEYLNISYEACPECKSVTTCNVKVKNTTPAEEETDEQGWVKVQDSFSKKILVDDEGAILTQDDVSTEDMVQTEEQLERDVMNEQPIQLHTNDPVNTNDLENEDNKIVDGKSESSMISHGNCRQMYLAKTMRFFVLRRDLSCSELVHRALLDKYKTACHWQPWCSINKHATFGDHRSTVSILTPIHLTETEKWLMNSKLSDKPNYLTYKDLSKEPKKGFYHWMRPYERFNPKPMKPDTVLPPRLPRAFVLRTLEQQWDLTQAEKLKGGKELLRAILKYRHVMESDSETILNIPLIDPRSESERCADEYMQSLGNKILKNRIYNDLKQRLEADMESRAKATITTKPLLSTSLEDFVTDEDGDQEMTREVEQEPEDEMEEFLKQTDLAETMSPELQRYWRRRAEELKEEEFFKYILRMGVVPPYFRNKDGGIWWSLHDLANKAVEKSERRKTKCICAEGISSAQDETSNYDKTTST